MRVSFTLIKPKDIDHRTRCYKNRTRAKDKNSLNIPKSRWLISSIDYIWYTSVSSKKKREPLFLFTVETSLGSKNEDGSLVRVHRLFYRYFDNVLRSQAGSVLHTNFSLSLSRTQLTLWWNDLSLVCYKSQLVEYGPNFHSWYILWLH